MVVRFHARSACLQTSGQMMPAFGNTGQEYFQLLPAVLFNFGFVATIPSCEWHHCLPVQQRYIVACRGERKGSSRQDGHHDLGFTGVGCGAIPFGGGLCRTRLSCPIVATFSSLDFLHRACPWTFPPAKMCSQRLTPAPYPECGWPPGS
jgi:hypothetical protein